VTDSQTETFRAALKEARASFDKATERLTAIRIENYQLNDKVGKLRRTITALAAMCSESPWLDPIGITDACEEVMAIEREDVTTQNVVEKLEAMGFDLSSQKNAAASVHSVLTRLAEKKKIEKITKEESGAVTWRGPNYTDSAEITDEDIPF